MHYTIQSLNFNSKRKSNFVEIQRTLFCRKKKKTTACWCQQQQQQFISLYDCFDIQADFRMKNDPIRTQSDIKWDHHVCQMTFECWIIRLLFSIKKLPILSLLPRTDVEPQFSHSSADTHTQKMHEWMNSRIMLIKYGIFCHRCEKFTLNDLHYWKLYEINGLINVQWNLIHVHFFW